VRYALGVWEALVRYCDDGRIEIDNSAAERALRAVVLGRKNYLFAGSDPGGERAAAIYSLIGSAKLNGIDPETYLREVLTRIADHPINRIADLPSPRLFNRRNPPLNQAHTTRCYLLLVVSCPLQTSGHDLRTPYSLPSVNTVQNPRLHPKLIFEGFIPQEHFLEQGVVGANPLPSLSESTRSNIRKMPVMLPTFDLDLKHVIVCQRG
jgi:hypothetical protein